jgi:Glycosyl transferase family 2
MMMTGKPSLRAAMNPLRWFLGGSVQGDLANGLVPSVVLGGPGASRDPATGKIPAAVPGMAATAKAVEPSMTVSRASSFNALERFYVTRPFTLSRERLQVEVAEMAADAFGRDMNYSHIKDLIERLFLGNSIEMPQVLDQQGEVFVENLKRTLGLRFPQAGTSPRPRQIIASPPVEDFLAADEADWTPMRLANFALQLAITPTRRAAVVTSVRNEGVAILEWLAHHRSLGFDAFFIYTNDNTDGSDELLRRLAQLGIITLIRNSVSDGTRIQKKVFEHSLHLLPELRQFSWVFYIDVDEFFVSRCEPTLDMNGFFARLSKRFGDETPSAVSFNWKWFGSENEYKMTDGLVAERFIYSIHNKHVKSLVKLSDVLSMSNIHYPTLFPGTFCVDSELEPVVPALFLKPTYGSGQLNHYWNKSFEEFAIKRARGRISSGISSPTLDFSSFFDWGANDERGNFDPPNSRVISRMKRDYQSLLALPGIEEELANIRKRTKEIIRRLEQEIDLKAVYGRRGRISDES